MEQQFILKIIDIQEELSDKCILVASSFDKKCKESDIYQDALGKKWNKYLNKNCSKYGFEIWKKKSDQNVYIKATDECRKEANDQGLTPHTTSELLRGEER